MHNKQIKIFYILILFLLLCAQVTYADPNQEGEETYEILQKGFITVQGKTNFFDFTGRADKHKGILHEVKGLYSGTIQLKFSDIDFNFPLISSILTEEQEGDPKKHSEIKIALQNLKPAELPTKVSSNLTLRGVTKPVIIQTKFTYISPVVKVEGSFIFNQTDFGMVPYSTTFVEVDNQIEIRFKAFFCETHAGIPGYHANDKEAIQKLLTEENIKILTKENFFGCSELEQTPATEAK